jgi:hypothetical protein
LHYERQGIRASFSKKNKNNVGCNEGAFVLVPHFALFPSSK